MASTRSVLAISGTESCVSLKRITDVREMTRRSRIPERRPNRAALVVDVAMNGHALALFPPPDGRDVTPQIACDFLPGFQTPALGICTAPWAWCGLNGHGSEGSC